MTACNLTSAVLETLFVPKALQSHVDGGFVVCQTPDVRHNETVFRQKPETMSHHMAATQTKTDVGEETSSQNN